MNAGKVHLPRYITTDERQLTDSTDGFYTTFLFLPLKNIFITLETRIECAWM